MTAFTCTWVRDRLPEYARDALDVADNARIDQHLAECADCSAEAQLVAAIAVPVTLPAAVESRVAAAVRSRMPLTARRWPGFRHYAIAASFAFALITGSVLWRHGGGQRMAPASPDVDIDAVLAQPSGADPLLHESGLQSLSEDELRILLEELES